MDISSFPNIDSRANAVASLLSDAMSVPVFSFITCSIDFNFGGVLKGTGGIVARGNGSGDSGVWSDEEGRTTCSLPDFEDGSSETECDVT